MPPGAATHGNRCQTVAGRTHPWRVTRQRTRHFRRGVLGIAYLFISHDLTAVRRLCHRTAVLYLGRLVEVGETEALFTEPLHPYSRALLSSVLYPDPAQNRVPFALQGEIPSPINQPP